MQCGWSYSNENKKYSYLSFRLGQNRQYDSEDWQCFIQIDHMVPNMSHHNYGQMKGEEAIFKPLKKANS